MFFAVLTAALFATSVIFGHRAARLAGSLEANFWRVILATLFLSLMAFSFGSGLAGGVVGWFALSGAVGVGLGDFAIYHALPRLGPRVTSLLVQCLMAVFAALFEWLWLGTTFSLVQGALSALILIGVIIALGTPEEVRGHARTLGPGIALAAFGAAGTAGGAVISRKAYEILHAHGTDLDGITAGFQRMIGGLIVSLIFYGVLRFVQRRNADGTASPLLAIATPERRKAWGWIIGNSLAGQTLGVSCMQWALSRIPAAQVLVITATTPILVIPLARIFEGERIRPRAAVGSVLAVAGVIGLIWTRTGGK
jgi:drug/metabolite transporter (DMT)-like permease